MLAKSTDIVQLGFRKLPTVTLLFHDPGIAGKAVDVPAFLLMLAGLTVAVPEMIALPPEPHVPADGRQMTQKAH